MPERLRAAEAEAAATARLIWTLFELAEATGGLSAAGYVLGVANTPAAGTSLYQQVEDVTDAAAAQRWSRLTRACAAELAGMLRPVARPCAVAHPFPSGFQA